MSRQVVHERLSDFEKIIELMPEGKAQATLAYSVLLLLNAGEHFTQGSTFL